MPVSQHSSTPALPLIKVFGHDWFLQIALLPVEEKIVMYSDLLFGSTNSLLGVFRTVAAIRRLAKWVDNTYGVFMLSQILA